MLNKLSIIKKANNMSKQKSLVTKYTVLKDCDVNLMDINDPKQLSKLKLYNDLNEATKICTEKNGRNQYNYSIYELQYELYIFKKFLG